ncbi:MAG TPA: AzlC family ABC transporter permease, partial [Gaiellaceae bacterium]|nr:AzlC family ABC transporter permease [Gaiellaceae bacterium]
TQALSLLVFAGSAQVSAVGLFGRGVGGLEVVLTTFLLNVRHVLYGVSLGRVVPMTKRERMIGAYLLTDEAYGVSVARGARSFPFVLGTEISLFAVWNVTTLVGALVGGVIPDPERLGVDFVFPVAFLALLVPLLRLRVDVAVALLAGATAWLLAKWLPGGVPILGAGVSGALLGARLTR